MIINFENRDGKANKSKNGLSGGYIVVDRKLPCTSNAWRGYMTYQEQCIRYILPCKADRKLLASLGCNSIAPIEIDQSFNSEMITFDNGVGVEVIGKAMLEGFSWRLRITDPDGNVKMRTICQTNYHCIKSTRNVVE